MFENSGHADFARFPRSHPGGICALLPNQMAEQVEVQVSLEKDRTDRVKYDVGFSEYFRLKAL